MCFQSCLLVVLCFLFDLFVSLSGFNSLKYLSVLASDLPQSWSSTVSIYVWNLICVSWFIRLSVSWNMFQHSSCANRNKQPNRVVCVSYRLFPFLSEITWSHHRNTDNNHLLNCLWCVLCVLVGFTSKCFSLGTSLILTCFEDAPLSFVLSVFRPVTKLSVVTLHTFYWRVSNRPRIYSSVSKT